MILIFGFLGILLTFNIVLFIIILFYIHLAIFYIIWDIGDTYILTPDTYTHLHTFKYIYAMDIDISIVLIIYMYAWFGMKGDR